MKTRHLTHALWILLGVPLLIFAAAKPLRITKVIQRSTASSTSLCAEVDRYFSATDGIAAKPYIKLTPPDYFGVSLSYDEICLTGLKPQKDYTFSIQRSIPLGEVSLDKSYRFTQRTTDYQPSMSFPDRGYILPAKGEISIPIKTTNIDRFYVTLYRINRENLIKSINEYGLFRTLSSYTLDKVKEQDGYLLWKKRLSIDAKKNHEKTTAIPVGKLLTKREPGVYILAATPIDSEGEEDPYSVITQWFMISDIGLFTMEGTQGLHVYCKHLSNAKTYPKVKLELVAKNNERLGSTMAKGGYALFPKSLLGGKRGLAPKAIYASGESGDFTVLDLSRPSHDLSDRGVTGREVPKSYDAWLYSNRAIFRPGETVPFHLLVRTPLGVAVSNLKLSVKLHDSRGVEIASRLITTDASGHSQGSFSLSPSASTGKWKITLYAGGKHPIGRLGFLVEDFVPPKISLSLKKAPQQLIPNQKVILDAMASYLAGDPLPHAKVEVNTILHAAATPFKQYTSYWFGKAGSHFKNQSLGTQYFEGGAEGNITIPLILKRKPRTSLPLSAHITLSASEPGGRPVQETLDLFYADKAAYIGIKAHFDNHAVDRDDSPTFDLVYLKNAQPTPATLHYRLIEEEVSWNWRSSREGDWEYYRSYSDREEVDKGTFQTSDHPALLTLKKLDWGSYRIEIEDARGILSSYKFTSGYEEPVSRASPDRLPVALDKQSYLPGEKIHVNITPKFSGPLLLSLANNRILETREIQATEGTPVTLTFETNASWGSSLYLLASAFRAQSKTLGATRAIGVAHIAVKNPKNTIHMTLEHPPRIHASSQLTVSVQTQKQPQGKTYLTLSAVDKGVLSLTHYKQPDPVRYFYGQRRLGVEIRDVYADLIKATGAHAQFDVGAGDEELEAALHDTVVSNKRKVVALFSKVIPFDAQGKAVTTFQIPDFQGTLTLTAVAWNTHALGSTTGEILVKDPISTELYLPRFMGEGDHAAATVRSSFDPTVESGSYLLKFHTGNGLEVTPEEISYTVTQGKTPPSIKTLKLHASKIPEGTIGLSLLHEGEVLLKREWHLGIRSAYPPAYIRKTGSLKPGETLVPKKYVSLTPWKNPRRIKFSLSGAPLLPTASMVKELTDYTGRCAEQTSSRAMPWLTSKEKDKRGLVQRAIERLSNMQRIHGGFGLWSNSETDTWLTAYVLDLFTRAKAQGYSVSERNINKGLSWLEQHLDRWSTQRSKQEGDAYALYVLARNHRILMSEIAFRLKDKKSLIRSAQAWGQLGAVLSSLGEEDKATILFDKAKTMLGDSSYVNYGGALRNKAALVRLIKEAGRTDEAQMLFADLALELKTRRYLSTQEMSMLLRASKVLDIHKSTPKLTVNGIPYQENAAPVFKADTLTALPSVTNQGTHALWYDLSFIATPDPVSTTSHENRGFSIDKHFYTLDGEPVDPSQIARNSRIVVVIKGTIQDSAIKHPLITDWLPAGFEIENPTISGIDASDGLKWLGKKSALLHAAYRDDRFEAALQNDSNNSFVTAYLVRAVTTGSFTLPPARIEDMYQPRYRAFSPLMQGKLLIKLPQDIQRVNTPAPTGKKEQTHPIGTLGTEDYTFVYTHPLGSLEPYTLLQINRLRNGIFAQAGLDFAQSNPALHKRFSTFAWYVPKERRSSRVYHNLSALQKNNVQALLREEKQRCGGLVLADFYRVKIKKLNAKYLKKYNKRELRILRNSLIAHYGLAFKDPELHRIYSQMPWYHPKKITASEILDQRMSDLERANVQTILKAERQK